MSDVFDANYINSVKPGLAPLSPESIITTTSSSTLAENNSNSHTSIHTLHPDQQHNSNNNNNNNIDNINNNIDNDLSPLFALKDSLEQKLRSVKDFTKAVIYSDDGTIIVSTYDVKPKEIFDPFTDFN